MPPGCCCSPDRSTATRSPSGSAKASSGTGMRPPRTTAAVPDSWPLMVRVVHYAQSETRLRPGRSPAHAWRPDSGEQMEPPHVSPPLLLSRRESPAKTKSPRPQSRGRFVSLRAMWVPRAPWADPSGSRHKRSPACSQGRNQGIRRASCSTVVVGPWDLPRSECPVVDVTASGHCFPWRKRRAYRIVGVERRSDDPPSISSPLPLGLELLDVSLPGLGHGPVSRQDWRRGSAPALDGIDCLGASTRRTSPIPVVQH